MAQQKQKCVATSAELKSTGKRKVTVGSIWPSKKCGNFEVVEVNGCWDVKIRFIKTGFCVKTTSQTIKVGNIKDKMSPSLHGVGFIGDGKFKASAGKVGTKIYNSWKRMFDRCYSGRYPTYKDCFVCEEWHNFQNFAEWYEDNYPQDGKDYQLDKDLKVIGNKEYSPSKCMFVSTMVNTFILDGSAMRGEFMIGACWHNSSQRIISQCRNPITGRQQYLGSFSSDIDAHLAWRKRKSELAVELAEMQSNKDVADALMRWKYALDSNSIHIY